MQHPMELIQQNKTYDILNLPVLTQSSIRMGVAKQDGVVKWRGMILDTLEPHLVNLPTSDNDSCVQRLTFRCRTIPGETEWTKKLYMEKETEDKAFECLVYVYDDEETSFKIHDTFEFVAVLDLETPKYDGLEEQVVENPSNLPRLHCIDAIRVDNFYLSQSPVKLHAREFKRPADNASRIQYIESVSEQLKDIADLRNHLITFLSEILVGDELAAEYLLLCLLARVHVRQENLSVGQVPLNLVFSNMQPRHYERYCVQLERCLSAIVPVCQVIPLTVEELCTKQLTPVKDYEKDTMIPGQLQLPKGALLVVNEMPLSPGQLNEAGLKNIKDLSLLVQRQVLKYDFKYYSMDFPLDTNILIISAKKSILDVELVVPVIAGEVTEGLFKSELPFMAAFQTYLSLIREMDFELRSKEAEFAQEYFVKRRQENRATPGEIFHLWLSLARLVTLSFGKTHLDQSMWHYMMNLENARAARTSRAAENTSTAQSS